MKNIVISLIILLPTAVFAECTCEPEDEERDKNLALKYKLVAIASILVASAIGVCLPVLGKVVPAMSPEKNFFFIVKSFAAGVILSTAFIHVLPDAFEQLTSPCISERPWGEFPFTGFIAMLAAVGTLMVDTNAMSYYNGRSLRNSKTQVDNEELGDVQATTHHGHEHGPLSLAVRSEETELLRHRIISQVLELGIIVHSVIIGIALGTSQSPKTIRPLIAALTFHQFFEGIGLGGCIAQARFKTKAVAIMGLFFSLTTPIGIAIGIGISNVYSETSPTAIIVQGSFDSAAAGILIYMALVDLLAADFMSPKLQSNGKLRLWANISLLLGAGCMSVLAKWA